MDIQNARSEQNGSIAATVDGITLSIPAQPGNRHYDAIIAGGVPVAPYASPAATADDVRAEAHRRIVAVVPEWRQRNLTARAAELSMQVAAGTPLTADQQAEWDAGQAVWAQVQAIRDASNGMEGNPPANYADDVHWPF